jgi:hypothetical protein
VARSSRRCPVCNSPLSEEAYQKAMAQHQGIHRELEQQRRLTGKLQRKVEDEKKASAERVRRVREAARKAADRDVRRERDKTRKYEQRVKTLANTSQKLAAENQRLKEQIERGETNQSQGLLEEKELLRFLRDKFPHDEYDHTGKGGDILQHVRTPRGQVVGCIVYEVKKVAGFQRAHVRQASEARRLRDADYCILVTNAFPAKQELFYVDRDVLVISPAGIEPLVHTARASLLSIHGLKASGEQKQKAVQAVYDYLAGSDYTAKIVGIAGQKLDLEKLFRDEVTSHTRVWKRRVTIYTNIFGDIAVIDTRLRHLLTQTRGQERKTLTAQPAPLPSFVAPKELAR